MDAKAQKQAIAASLAHHTDEQLDHTLIIATHGAVELGLEDVVFYAMMPIWDLHIAYNIVPGQKGAHSANMRFYIRKAIVEIAVETQAMRNLLGLQD